MYIRVAKNGEPGLQDSDNFRALSIVRAAADAALAGLLEIATATEDNRYWLDADAALELSGRKHDQQWLRNFRALRHSDATCRLVR